MIAPIQPVQQSQYPELQVDAYSIYIGSDNVTSDAEGIEVEYLEEGGGSKLSFVSHSPLDGLSGRTVTLRIGPDQDRYMVGTLERPGDPDDYFSRSATVLGPLARMTGLYFGEEVSYSGYSVASALYDVFLRSGFPRGTMEVRGGLGQRIEDLVFPEEVSLSEGMLAILDTGGFVAADIAGGGIAMPRPRPGATGKAVARLDEGDYAQKGFRIPRKTEARYSKVVVFRRNDDGSYAVRAIAPVPNDGSGRPAPPNSIYYIPDFAGDVGQAKQTAYETAKSVASGEVVFEMDLLELDSTLRMYDQVTAFRNDDRRDGTYRETYQLVIDKGIQAGVSKWSTTLSGSGLLVAEQKIAAPVIFVTRPSAGLMTIPVTSGPAITGVTWDDVRTFEDLGAYTFEELS